MAPPYAGSERRKFRRAEASFIITYKINYPLSIRLLYKDKAMDALAFDLSEGGMAVSTGHEIPAGTQVTIHFVLLNESAVNVNDRLRSLQISAQISYCTRSAEKEFRLGVVFGGISADERLFIAGFTKAYFQKKRP